MPLSLRFSGISGKYCGKTEVQEEVICCPYSEFAVKLFVSEMRSLQEVKATLEIAKLKEDDLQSVTHCLAFGENVSSGDYCLMELDEALCKHIEAGKR